ncbi:MAG: TolC family protein, partial [Nevskiales bacterium]
MNIPTSRASAWQLYPLTGLLLLSAAIAHAGESEAGSNSARQLTLDETVQLALTRQPLLENLTAQLRATRESAVAAQQLPDPQLIAGIQDLPINTRDAYSLRRDSDTQLQLGLMQEFPRAKKRRLRGELVERDAQRLEAEHHLAQRTIRRDAALAWLELWRYTQSLQLTRASLHEADTQVAAVEIALKTGSATQADLLSARVEVARLQDEVAGTEQSIGHARNLLSRWIGEAAWRPIAGTLPQAPAEPSLNVALEHVRRHPHLAMHQAQIAAAQTGTNLAKADYDPDWRVELGYANRPAFSDMLTLQFGVDLPV